MLDSAGRRYPVDEYGVRIVEGSKRPACLPARELKRLSKAQKKALMVALAEHYVDGDGDRITPGSSSVDPTRVAVGEHARQADIEAAGASINTGHC